MTYIQTADREVMSVCQSVHVGQSKACESKNLYIMFLHQIKKALELYEQLRQRTGVVVVGPSGSGKSTLWRILRLGLQKLNKTVKHYTMNPKAMPRTQLLGSIDMDTREWTDGVLTYSARQVVKEPQGLSSLFIFTLLDVVTIVVLSSFCFVEKLSN